MGGELGGGWSVIRANLLTCEDVEKGKGIEMIGGW